LQVNRKEIFGLIAARSALQKREILYMDLKSGGCGGNPQPPEEIGF